MRVALVVHDRCEDLEAFATRALLVRSGLEVETVNPQPTITTAFGLTVSVDRRPTDLDPKAYAMLILPGGKYVAEVIETNTWIPALIEAFDALEKPLAAICAGPRFLGRAKLLDDQPFTAYPGSEVDMQGEYHPEHKALTHGRIITGRSAGSVYAFAYEIVRYLQGETQAKWLQENILE